MPTQVPTEQPYASTKESLRLKCHKKLPAVHPLVYAVGADTAKAGLGSNFRLPVYIPGWLACTQLLSLTVQAVLVNFPHNPTGAHLSHSDWQRVCNCCQANDSYLFSDEKYRHLEHDPEALLPSAVDSYERGISLSGMSKALSMPGLQQQFRSRGMSSGHLG